MAHHSTPTAGPCPNCATLLKEGWHFCPSCGQKNEDIKLPLSHILEEVAEGIWHFDSKFWATLRAIVTHPGRPTLDFLEGKRVRYVPPIRLYVFVSFLFFFLASVYQHHQKLTDLEIGQKKHGFNFSYSEGFNQPSTPEKDTVDKDEARYKVYAAFKEKVEEQSEELYQLAEKGILLSAKDARELQKDPHKALGGIVIDTLFSRLNPSSLANLNPSEFINARTWFRDEMYSDRDTVILKKQGKDTYLAQVLPHSNQLIFDSVNSEILKHGTIAEKESLMAANGKSGYITRLLLERQAKLKELNKNKNEDWMEKYDFMHTILKFASVGMFVFMPLVALFLFLLFRHQRRYYLEHLIHSVHLHAILFLAICLLLFLPELFLPEAFHTPLWILLMFILLIYPFLSIRRVYRQQFRRTLGKYLVLMFGYGILTLLFVFCVLLYWVAVF